jgi:hypothetical protein
MGCAAGVTGRGPCHIVTCCIDQHGFRACCIYLLIQRGLTTPTKPSTVDYRDSVPQTAHGHPMLLLSLSLYASEHPPIPLKTHQPIPRTCLGRQRPSSVSQTGRSLGQQCCLSGQQVAPSMGQQPQLKQKPAMSLQGMTNSSSSTGVRVVQHDLLSARQQV